MWPEGQWEALNKTAPKGAEPHTDRRTTWLYDWMGPVRPIQWKSCIQEKQTFKCCKQCEQRSCKILQDWGKYFALTIPCFVVNAFYVPISPLLWCQIGLVMLFLPILSSFLCSLVTLVAFRNHLNSFNCILIAAVNQYMKYIYCVVNMFLKNNFTLVFGSNFIAKNNACVKMGGNVITCHLLTDHLSSFSAVQWSIGLGVKTLFLWDEVLDQHGMTSWLLM